MGFWQYCRECCRVGLQLSALSISKIAGGIVIAAVTALLGPLHIVSKQSAFHSFVDGLVSFIIYVICAWLILFLLQGLFAAPYRIWKTHKKHIKELEKVGKDDLERMLHGKYVFGDATFLYGGDIGYICRDFKSKGDIEQLKDVFTAIQVPAPKEAIAHIRFDFRADRTGTDERCHFYFMKDGEPVEIENIYDTQAIRLDQEGCFKLKVAWGSNFKFEHASLRITVAGWTK